VNLAFDTSFLVAALIEGHVDHPRTLPWTEAVASGEIEARLSWHAAAETWSVLTRLPGTLRVQPSAASLVIDRLLETFEPAALSAATYRAALRRCAEKGLASGAVFDALHLASAEEQEVDGLVTFNGSDFERLRTPRSPEIVVPPHPPAFRL